MKTWISIALLTLLSAPTFAQGPILLEKSGKIVDVTCYTEDGKQLHSTSLLEETVKMNQAPDLSKTMIEGRTAYLMSHPVSTDQDCIAFRAVEKTMTMVCNNLVMAESRKLPFCNQK